MPLAPPSWTATGYRQLRSDAAFWRPYLAEVLARHGRGEPAGAPGAGENPTYPTFLWGDVAVKLYGGPLAWREAWQRERRAHEVLAADPAVPAPEGLGAGELFPGARESWPYLVTARASGVPWSRASAPRERAWAGELGAVVRRVQALEGGPRAPVPEAGAVLAALEGSALPGELWEGVEDFLSRWPGKPPVFTHGDLVGMHVFVDGATVSAVIDWGDAGFADPHYELGKPLLGLFRGDPGLREAFLEGAGWARGEGFAQRALAQALRRQADGRAQHLGFDIFHRVPELLAGRRATGLGELAGWLFGV